MSKSFIDIVMDSCKTGLGLPVKTRKPLLRTMLPLVESHFGFKLYKWLDPALSRVRIFHHLCTPPPPTHITARPGPTVTGTAPCRKYDLSPAAHYTGPTRCYYYVRSSRFLVLITCVMANSHLYLAPPAADEEWMR